MIQLWLNIIWLVLGGLPMALAWWVAALLAAISVIGFPWARSCWVIGKFSLWPFGTEVVNRRQISGRADIGTGVFGLLGNVLWFLIAGWWLAIGHISSALACFVTVIGIPFGVQHLKMALIAIAPMGMTVIRKRNIR